MKKLIIIAIMLAFMAGMLVACNRGNEPSGTGDNQASEMFVIGILQYLDHTALDAAHDGFVGRLEELGFVRDVNVQFIRHNAGRDSSVAAQMAESLVAQNPNLILTIATGASQAVARATEDIPIVITAVTCPYTAGIIDSFEVPGRNVTGVSDLTPVAVQIDLITRLLPEARVIGLLYNSGEVNSVFQANIAREAILAHGGLSYVVANAPSLLEVSDVTQSLVGLVDVIYVPTCNTVAGAYAAVMLVADENNIPVIVGESAGVRYGALATEGIDYYLLGRQTADMAAQILRGEAVPAEMPIQWQQEAGVLSINMDTAERLGITISDEMLEIAQIIRDSD